MPVENVSSVTAALRGQPEPPNPVELENLAAMLRAAAAAIQAWHNLLCAAAGMRHAAWKNMWVPEPTPS